MKLRYMCIFPLFLLVVVQNVFGFDKSHFINDYVHLKGSNTVFELHLCWTKVISILAWARPCWCRYRDAPLRGALRECPQELGMRHEEFVLGEFGLDPFVFVEQQEAYAVFFIVKEIIPKLLRLTVDSNRNPFRFLHDYYVKFLHAFLVNGIKFALFNNSTPGLYQDQIQRTFITDAECNFFNNLMLRAYNDELYTFPNRWIIFGHYSEIVKKNYYFPINSYVILIDNSKRNNAFEIITLYKIKEEFPGYLQALLGMWTRESGFLFYNEISLTANRSNLARMPLKVSYIFQYNSSLDHIYDNRERHLDKITKINYLLFHIFVDIWNMTHEKIITTEYGMEMDPVKKFYKGMLGDIYTGRADISGTLAFTPKERFQYFKFLVNTISKLSLNFVFRAPPLPYTTNFFALPFHKYVWYSCGLIIVFCGVVIRIITKWEERTETFIVERARFKEDSPHYLDIVMMQIAVVCQMDYFHEPRSTSGKIGTFTLLLTFIYIYTAFSARIVLLLQSTSDNLRDLQTLYDSNIKMGIEDLNYNRFYIKNPQPRTNERWRKLIYENRIAPKGAAKENYYSAEEGMRMVQTSFFAFYTEITTANNLIEESYSKQEKCSVRYIETFMKWDTVYLCCKKNSTLSEYFLIGLHRLFETGIQNRQIVKILSKLPKCTGNNNIFVSVGLKESYFAFYVFGGGIGLSLFIFILEIVSHIYLKFRTRNGINIVQPFVSSTKSTL